MMDLYENAKTLAITPERWFVDLTTGDTLEVLTHGYHTEDGHYVFSLLFEGEPNFEVTVLRLPVHLVAGTRG